MKEENSRPACESSYAIDDTFAAPKCRQVGVRDEGGVALTDLIQYAQQPCALECNLKRANLIQHTAK